MRPWHSSEVTTKLSIMTTRITSLTLHRSTENQVALEVWKPSSRSLQLYDTRVRNQIFKFVMDKGMDFVKYIMHALFRTNECTMHNYNI